MADLLVMGAGPYGVATAARALERGIDTVVAGRPMGFWYDNMPRGMFLRSGPDWHLDAAGVHTFEAFLADRKISARDVDPVPIGVFLEYAAWFQREKGIAVRPDMVTSISRSGTGFGVEFEDGDSMTVESVVAATGISRFQQLPGGCPMLRQFGNTDRDRDYA